MPLFEEHLSAPSAVLEQFFGRKQSSSAAEDGGGVPHTASVAASLQYLIWERLLISQMPPSNTNPSSGVPRQVPEIVMSALPPSVGIDPAPSTPVMLGAPYAVSRPMSWLGIPYLFGAACRRGAGGSAV